MVLNNDSDVKSGSEAANGRKSLQAVADFEAGFQAAGATPKEAVLDPEGQRNTDVHKN